VGVPELLTVRATVSAVPGSEWRKHEQYRNSGEDAIHITNQ